MKIQTHHPKCNSAWPELNHESWKETLKTLHLFTQIVGKVRLQSMPWQNHSWHTTLYVSPRGFSTQSMPYSDGIFEIEFDFENHCLSTHSTFHDTRSFSLKDISVAEFYKKLMADLEAIGLDTRIHNKPNEMAEAKPFEDIHHHNSYDTQAAINFWQATVSIHNVFQKFRSGFKGKCSPVHLFWGAFDLAITRFSGRPAPKHPGGMPNMPLEVMQEAYSMEVSSAGFWPGGDDFPKAIFYSYCYPANEDFGKAKVLPKEAQWNADLGEFVLEYDFVRKSEDPAKTLMDFLSSTYEAAAISGDWDRKNLEVEK